MAGIIGNHTITEYNINVSIESEDGRTKLSSNGAGVAAINLTVNRGAVGVVNAIQFNPLAITFPADVTADLTGVKPYAEVERTAYIAGKVKAIGIYETEIDIVPGFPVDLTDEYFDVNVLDEKGVGMVCTLLSNGDLTGDIDITESVYNDLTGYLYIKWNRPLKQGQNVTYRKNYTNPPSDPAEFTLTGLVGYDTVSEYTLAAKTFDQTLNKPTPVAPGSVVITTKADDGTTITIKDDGKGNLTGAGLSSVSAMDDDNTNTINYLTGEINLKFSYTLMAGEPIYLKHISLIPVKNYRLVDDSKQDRLKVILPWEDLARIVRSVEQTAGVVETGLKYRADT